MSDKLRITPAALAAAAQGDIENFLAAATPGGIEAQEARGQQQFVASATLPRKFNSGTKDELEQMGVRFGANVDDLFCRATLPAGWQKIATRHSMWSKLVDAAGRERASMFYKAAFYDRDAFINVARRFSFSEYAACDADGNFVENADPTHYAVVITDGGKPMHSIGIRPAENSRDECARHAAAAEAWLGEHYPDWHSKTAYWD